MVTEIDSDSMRVARPTTTLRQLALEKMRNAILEFQFAPGERLVERRLCDLLGVSRTVVREVLRHLEAEGLVTTQAHQGPVVAMLDPKSVEQIYEIRDVLERMAARALAKNADKTTVDKLSKLLDGIESAKSNLKSALEQTTEFYETLFLSSGRSVAWEIVRNLNARINALRALTLTSTGRPQAGLREMRAMVDAIRVGDADAAEAACHSHVMNAYEIAEERLGESFKVPVMAR